MAVPPKGSAFLTGDGVIKFDYHADTLYGANFSYKTEIQKIASSRPYIFPIFLKLRRVASAVCRKMTLRTVNFASCISQ